MNLLSDIRAFVSDEADSLLSIQRQLHAIPEPGFEEVKTSAFIRDYLRSLGLNVRSYADLPTAVISGVKGRIAGRKIGLRCEIDALGVHEETTLSHRSRHTGYMHACGHDYHMAVTLGLAHLFSRLSERLSGEILFIFQPAEEPSRGGAMKLSKKKIMHSLDAIIGFHNNPLLSVEEIILRDGQYCAGISRISITIHGSGGHTARPDLGDDLIGISSELISGINQYLRQILDPREAAVLCFGQIHAGSSHNVIPEQLTMTGTLRILNEDIHDFVVDRLKQFTHRFAEAFDIRVDFNSFKSSPAVYNDPKLISEIRSTLNRYNCDHGIISDSRPSMGGEDFSYYSQKIPGAYLSIGSKLAGATSHELHSPHFRINDDFIRQSIMLLGLIIGDLLHEGSVA